MNDDELLARLKSADPALTGVAPPPDIDRLVEDTLNTDTALQSATTAAGIATASWGRRHLFGLAAAGLLVLGGGVAGGIMANSGGGNGHSASAKTVAPAGALRLTAEGGSGKCMAPGVDTLGKYPTLFEGTATSVRARRPLSTWTVVQGRRRGDGRPHQRHRGLGDADVFGGRALHHRRRGRLRPDVRRDRGHAGGHRQVPPGVRELTPPDHEGSSSNRLRANTCAGSARVCRSSAKRSAAVVPDQVAGRRELGRPGSR